LKAEEAETGKGIAMRIENEEPNPDRPASGSFFLARRFRYGA
jgi:hypothetical protein